MSTKGASLQSVVIGTSDLARALDFYCGLIGMEVCERVKSKGPAFTRHWRLPDGSDGEAVLLRAVDCPVGQVLLIKFGDGKGARVRPKRERAFVGLFNLNFYVRDLMATAKEVTAQGIKLWAQPQLPADQRPEGRTLEALLDGPDDVVINMVELYGGNETTIIGKLRGEVDAFGRTITGFTPVATSTHLVADGEAAMAFYRDVLGMQVMLDMTTGTPEANRMMGRPDEGKTRVVLFTGGHMFGKVLLSQPVNYTLPSLTEGAVPPAVGYLAQSFLVPDLDDALAKTRASLFSSAIDLDVPGLGSRRAAIVRSPGSGALLELVQA